MGSRMVLRCLGSHILDSRLADGGEVVSLTCLPRFIGEKVHDIHFCWRLSQPQDHNAAGRISLIKKSNNIIWY
jgi:hypothetical protein